MSTKHWYNNDVESAIKELRTSREGLSEQEARVRLETYGFNEIVETGKKSPVRMFLEEFTDPMVIILLVAIVISVVTSFMPGAHEEGGLVEAMVITAIVIFNAVFGFIQEYRSEQALEALKSLAAPRARVKRDGLWKEIDSRYVVPGDIISLEAGNKIPADGRIIYAVGLSADESALTGESVSVRKVEDTIHLDSPVVGDMRNMVFQGTTIVSGKGQAVVTSTGMNTYFGKIARMVQESEKDETPLQRDLADLGKKLGVLVIALCIIVFGAEIIRDISDSLMDELLAAIALAVSAIPEGLPAVVTITLAIGVQQMVQRNAIVRRLPSVETLGSTTVICSDKTGTITKNEMTVKQIYADGKVIDVSGVGYNRDGGFTIDDSEYDVISDPHVLQIMEIGQVCTNSTLQPDQSGKADWDVVGDPTEGALLVMAEKAGLSHESTLSKYKEVSEISFDSARKRMTSICQDESGSLIAYMKGAPEVIVTLCSHIFENGSVRPITEDDRARILRVNESFAKDALRVLAFAYRQLAEYNEDAEPEQIEREMVFVGLVGMMDPPREEVRDAIKVCKKAGIRPVMITGDHELTARAIAYQVDLLEEGGPVYTGTALDKMTDEEFLEAVRVCNVYARVAPEHKLKIVDALKSDQQVVAMTGDGVNDAPAVKAADVGVAMGVRGADVTKEASDVILTDDNFATIVTAVEKGREIYSNIRKFVRFLLAANFDEIFLIFTIIMIGLPLPITPIQILWLNLATDGFPALALGVDPPEPGVMNRPPRKPGSKMMNRGMASFVVIAGFIAFLSSLTIFFTALNFYGGWIPGLTGPMVDWSAEPWKGVLTHARTAVFAGVVSFELIFVWNCRDEYRWIWETHIRQSKALLIAVFVSVILTLATIYVPFMQPLFQTVPLNAADWIIIVGTAIPVLFIPPHLIFGHKEEHIREFGHR